MFSGWLRILRPRRRAERAIRLPMKWVLRGSRWHHALPISHKHRAHPNRGGHPHTLVLAGSHTKLARDSPRRRQMVSASGQAEGMVFRLSCWVSLPTPPDQTRDNAPRSMSCTGSSSRHSPRGMPTGGGHRSCCGHFDEGGGTGPRKGADHADVFPDQFHLIEAELTRWMAAGSQSISLAGGNRFRATCNNR